ncbi:SAM-dependent methyltransferase [Amaricoccus sp.]|uniref:class I SAM-dependent methyltransferase n=1 Tax=Amaricoccus sp. TaxID=1872485 RepID=UPI00261F0DB7|nr:SAM-dependent methyltransferase [Amaricoccus sp.]HRO10526.1 SAM-dependent methyltransferase [Amaricoccus sp.]
MTGFAAALRTRIEARGPLRLDAWMAACNDRYYATRDPLGAGGDFTTAPEISQMFGELLGLWLAQAWVNQGGGPFLLAELGPGRGTLMRDALRAAAVQPGFTEAARLWLVERSPTLGAAQRALLPGARSAARLEDLPGGPLFLVANEFFDALPIRQFQRTESLWRERLVGPDGFLWGAPRPDAGLDARFPHLPDGAIAETSPQSEAIAAHLGARIALGGGAALVVDYGAWDGHGDTLQAVAGHAFADPLAAPGEADLTAHVRFRALAEAGRPARAFGPVGQGPFLERLGITTRAQALARGRPPETRAQIAAAHRRLTHPDEMGTLFQALALLPAGAPAPPGFDG